MRSKSYFVNILILFFAIGLFLSICIHSSQKTSDGEVAISRPDELMLKIIALNEENKILRSENAALEEKLQNARDEKQALDDLMQDLEQVKMTAGQTAVKGRGVVVTLEDSIGELQTDDYAGYGLVHDKIILDVVNEMKGSEAEAISVNGQRITAMSEIRCAGTLILVNWNKIGPPFVIKAIGDPQLLKSGMCIRGGCLDILRARGLQVQIEVSDDIYIPSVKTPVNLKFCSPAVEEKY